MRLRDIFIIESYAVASQVFSKEAPAQDVRDRLEQFKQLSQRNILKPEENDLTKWIKRGWASFDSFIASAESRTSKRDDKSAAKKESIRVAENDDWLVVIPLSKEASCFYGKGTEWCTAATQSQNYFDTYFYNNNITLLYFINKKSGVKLAAAYHHSNSDWECFDANDKRIDLLDISRMTGYDEDVIGGWVRDHSGKTKAMRDAKFTPEAAKELIDDYFKKFEETEKELYGIINNIDSMDTSWQSYRDKIKRDMYNLWNIAYSNILHIAYAGDNATEDGRIEYGKYLDEYAKKTYPEVFQKERGERISKLNAAYIAAKDALDARGMRHRLAANR